MKRREAIHNIATVSAGIVFLSSCEFLEVEPVYSNLPLQGGQSALIEQLSKRILPTGGLKISTPESTIDFILTMVNDCYAPEDIEKYLAGLNEFQLYLKEYYNGTFQKIDPDKQEEILEFLDGSKDLSEELQYFYSTTRRHTIQHFTSSGFFMTNYLDYEMVPGSYIGCETIAITS